MSDKSQSNASESKPETFLIEAGKSTHFLSKKVEQVAKRPWWNWVILGTFLVFIAVLLVGYLTISKYIRAFESASNSSVYKIYQEVKAGLNKEVFTDKERINILILGLDEIANQKEGSLLTDTMMIASIEPNGDVHLVSIPRDLWIQELQTKINALYYYGEESESTTGKELTTTVVEDVMGLEIDYPLVIKLTTLEEVIDAVGGVDVDVEKAFTDNEFPRDDVDPSSPDPTVLYETVSFNRGENHLNGDTALKYIRSRHSEDLEEGTDDARSRRQRQVVNALVQKIQTWEVVSNPVTMGKLYTIWKEMEEPISLTELTSLGKSLYTSEVKLKGSAIPISNDEVKGLLVNPPINKHGLWVYEPVDPTWKQLQNWVQVELEK